jgi:hypothetical protein
MKKISLAVAALGTFLVLCTAESTKATEHVHIYKHQKVGYATRLRIRNTNAAAAPTASPPTYLDEALSPPAGH